MNSKVIIENEINAPKEKVWDAFTQADHITKWNFASEDWHCPTAEIDLVPGGNYKTRMEAKDGSFGFDFLAKIESVEPNSKLSYVLDDGRNVVSTLEETSNGTKIRTEFDPEMQNPIELQQQGWQAILNNFKQYVEAQS